MSEATHQSLNDITPAQYISLEFDTPLHETVSSPNGNAFIFTLASYMNITIIVETQGNLSLNIPFFHDGMTTLYYTNFSNYSRSVYLSPQQYSFTVLAENGKTSEYWITLSEGEKVVDNNNHEISSAFLISENQIVEHTLNYTDNQAITNWYNFSIVQMSSYRFNLDIYKDSSIAAFDILSEDAQWHSTFFPVANFSDTIVTYMTSGNYSMRVALHQNPYVKYPIQYKLWFTSQYELQAPEDLKIGDQMYGVVERFTKDVYNLQVETDSVIWVIASNSMISVQITGNNINQSVSVYIDPPTLTDYMIYIKSGNYNVTIYSTSDGYKNYIASVRMVQPDRLESTDNSREKPTYLEKDRSYYGFTIHIPTDVDWFSINGMDNEQGYITLDRGVDLKVFDSEGNNVNLNLAAGYSYYFLTSAQTYIIEVYIASGEIAVLSYHAQWSSFKTQIPTFSSHTKITETSFKIGSPFGETLVLMAIPIILIKYLRNYGL